MRRRCFPLRISQDCAHWLSYEPFRTMQVVTEGLQALYLAFRDIPEAEYKQWAAIYNRAATMAAVIVSTFCFWLLVNTNTLPLSRKFLEKGWSTI